MAAFREAFDSVLDNTNRQVGVSGAAEARKPPEEGPTGGFQRSRLGGRLARPAGMGIGTTVASTRSGHAGFSKI